MPSAKMSPYQLHALEARWREWVIPPSGIDRLSHYIWSALSKFVGRSVALDLSSKPAAAPDTARRWS